MLIGEGYGNDIRFGVGDVVGFDINVNNVANVVFWWSVIHCVAVMKMKMKAVVCGVVEGDP